MRVRNIERFPFCVATVAASGIEVPSMDYAMKWWWRVRKWRFTHTLTYGLGGAAPMPSPLDFFAHDASYLIGGAGPPVSESKLQCPELTYIQWEESDSGPPGWVWSLQAMTEVSDDGTVRVGFGFAVHVDDANDLGGPVPIAGYSSADLVTMHFDGVDVPLFDNGSNWSGAIDFTPIEFWPYAQTDGTKPIWNASTGARLLPTDQPVI